MLNKIVLQGRLTDNLELRHTQSNTAVASGTIAVQRSRKDNNGEYQSDFCSVVLWSKLAEHASTWFHKGDMCIVSGRLESRDWQDKNGNKRTATEIIAEEVLFGGSKSTGKAEEKPAESEQGGFEEVDGENDLPFN